MILTNRCSEKLAPFKSALTAKSALLRRLLLTALMITATVATACSQGNSPDVEWLIDVLGLKQGSVVAEIGAGDGDETRAVARHIGPEGHIFSSELGSDNLQELRDAVEEASVENVTVIEGQPARTNLPEQCCDAIYMRRVYHHFGDPPAMNASIYQSLKPGGRLAIIDFEPRGSEADPGGRADGSQHGVTADTVVEELKQAGFQLVSSEQRSGRDFYIVMEKPEDS